MASTMKPGYWPLGQSPAARGGGPPTIDIQKTCQVNTAALNTIMGGEINQDRSVGVMDEQAAREELVKDWASFPAIAKDCCVQPKGRHGVADLLADDERDVLELRKKTKSSGSTSDISTSGLSTKQRPSLRRASPSTTECPVVKYDEGGSIEYITNCTGLACQEWTSLDKAEARTSRGGQPGLAIVRPRPPGRGRLA